MKVTLTRVIDVPIPETAALMARNDRQSKSIHAIRVRNDKLRETLAKREAELQSARNLVIKQAVELGDALTRGVETSKTLTNVIVANASLRDQADLLRSTIASMLADNAKEAGKMAASLAKMKKKLEVSDDHAADLTRQITWAHALIERQKDRLDRRDWIMKG